LVAFSLSAAAADLKQDFDKMVAAYAEGYKKQDPAAIAKLYANGGMLVLPTGAQTDIAKAYEGAFKAGFNETQIKTDQVLQVGADTGIAVGEYRITGKDPSGKPLDVPGRWTAVYVVEGGSWKIRMLTAFPKAPPPQ